MTDNPTTNPSENSPVDPKETPEQRGDRLNQERKEQIEKGKGNVENPSTDEPERGDKNVNR